MKYEAVIGLEVHAELSTKSKIYCSCSTGFGAPINTHTCPVCTGMPGRTAGTQQAGCTLRRKDGQGYRLHHQSAVQG